MRKTTYEWVVEEMDSVGGEIVDTWAHDTLAQAQKDASEINNPCAISLRRDIGEGPDAAHLDIVDRRQAYPGDVEFDGGGAIPKKLFAQLAELGPLT